MTTKSMSRQIDEAHAVLTEAGVPQHDDLAQRIRNALSPGGPDKLLTSHEVGAMLQMDPSSVVKWVNDGLLPAYRTPGGHRRIKASELLVFLRKHQMFIPPTLLAA